MVPILKKLSLVGDMEMCTDNIFFWYNISTFKIFFPTNLHIYAEWLQR